MASPRGAGRYRFFSLLPSPPRGEGRTKQAHGPSLVGETKTMSSSLNQAPNRVVSVDAYRGLVMFLMMAEALHLSRVAQLHPNSELFRFLAYHQTHVEWAGCSLHDLIQPSFSFLVGVALPFSLASRLAKGQSLAWATVHAVWRSVVLIFLGVFL